MTDDNNITTVHLESDVAALFHEYATARSAASKWKTYERATRDQLLAALGYEEKDPKPAPIRAIAPNGDALFEVNVSFRKGLDTEYLKSAHPYIYAEAEKISPVKTIGIL